MRWILPVAIVTITLGCGGPETLTGRDLPAAPDAGTQSFPIARQADPREVRLANLRQLTDGGENAEAYFSFDSGRLVFQSTRPPFGCDQIFTMNLSGGEVRLLSTGIGRTTCAFFLPDDRRFLYSSTHEHSPECPPRPDSSEGYVWPLYPYDIYVASLDDLTPHNLTRSGFYDAEATVCGDRIVFTSTRDGDLELYTMGLDGSDVRRITHEPGYDGGAFFSADCSRIVWRASRPAPGRQLDEYRRLLALGKIRPSQLDIYVASADGSDVRRLTDNGAANFAPFFHPAGDRVIFASNLHEPGSRVFELFLINIDGTGLERVTYHDDFDGFPMFSPDGATLVFGSNRFNSRPGETNVFLADWVDSPF